MRIDHVIIGARDIEAVADRLWERHGLASLPGGRHPGWGTQIASSRSVAPTSRSWA